MSAEGSSLMDDRRLEAIRMRADGLLLREIATRFGVSMSTALRWTDPAHEERTLRQAREAKRRRGGKCVDCGSRTSLGNGRRPGVAERCLQCRIRFAETELRYWTRERALDAARRWAEEHGRPPAAADWRRAHPDRLYPRFAECYGYGTLGKREGWRTWNEFLQSAGLSTWKSGQHGSTPRTEVAA